MERRTPTLERWGHTLTLALLGGKLAVLLVNARFFSRLRRTASVPNKSRVSLLIPARDEAANLRETLPLLLGQGAGEVLVLDDGSQDDTAAVARALGATVLSGQPLPPGWSGKTWACQQLAGAAGGELLVFTDADVHWQPGALDAVLHEAARTQADLLSVWPRQLNQTIGERLITPLLDNLLLCWLPAPLVKLPFASASAANGQVMAFRRPFYWRLGGHAAVKGAVMEDVAFARTVKAARGRLALALGGELLGVRMYRHYPASVRGIAKIVLPFHRGCRPALLLTWLMHFLVYTVPLWRRCPLPLALAVLEGYGVRRLVGRTGTADWCELLLTPILPLLTLPVYLLGWRRKVLWKGREYRQGPE